MLSHAEGQSPASGPRSQANGVRRLHLVFTGEVQGVGFRWTAQRVAQQLRMTGWVRNEYDRSVTMELQGTDTQISEFFGRFNRAYASYPIDYVIEEKREVAVVESEQDFHVRFS